MPTAFVSIGLYEATERRGRGYILTKAVDMAYGDNGPLFTKLLDAVGGA